MSTHPSPTVAPPDVDPMDRVAHLVCPCQLGPDGLPTCLPWTAFCGHRGDATRPDPPLPRCPMCRDVPVSCPVCRRVWRTPAP